jgi:hypothetical protein
MLCYIILYYFETFWMIFYEYELAIEFVDIWWLITRSNYTATANSHTLQFTV